jgi:hypothetical protein
VLARVMAPVQTETAAGLANKAGKKKNLLALLCFVTVHLDFGDIWLVIMHACCIFMEGSLFVDTALIHVPRLLALIFISCLRLLFYILLIPALNYR